MFGLGLLEFIVVAIIGVIAIAGGIAMLVALSLSLSKQNKSDEQ